MVSNAAGACTVLVLTKEKKGRGLCHRRTEKATKVGARRSQNWTLVRLGSTNHHQGEDDCESHDPSPATHPQLTLLAKGAALVDEPGERESAW
jgi:hypothetical protein